MRKRERGITLISLIITVIILLILATVAINFALGDNGIFKVANEAKEGYIEGQNKEEKDLENFTVLC